MLAIPIGDRCKIISFLVKFSTSGSTPTLGIYRQINSGFRGCFTSSSVLVQIEVLPNPAEAPAELGQTAAHLPGSAKTQSRRASANPAGAIAT